MVEVNCMKEDLDNDTPVIQTFNPGFKPLLTKNDRTAKFIIWAVSIVVFIVVTLLANIKLDIKLGFDPHLFATINAGLNSCVAILLVVGLWSVKKRNYVLHRRIMITAIILSLLFLLSYICHHLFTAETRYGDVNLDGLISDEEKSKVGTSRILYYIILGTHIPLAGIILPFILFTAYRSLTGEYDKHRKLARITWPVWLYVAITGVIVYLMINRYYQ